MVVIGLRWRCSKEEGYGGNGGGLGSQWWVQVAVVRGQGSGI